MNEIKFAPEGLAKLAKIVRQARGDLSYRKFQSITGISHASIRSIEIAEDREVRFSTLAKIAPHTSYSIEELVAICQGRDPNSLNLREYMAQVSDGWFTELSSEEAKYFAQKVINLSSINESDLIALLKAIAARLETNLTRHQ